jgi:L-methionine (R)-S-oxide reductase
MTFNTITTAKNHPLTAEVAKTIAEAPDAKTAMARAVATLKAKRPHYTWAGIYLLEGDTLVLGPYLGKPSPHTRIPLGRGICGAAATEKSTIIVDDVNSDPRYLACSLETKSEIVVPILDPQDSGRVLGEIDIDSDQAAAFTSDDRALLEEVAKALAKKLA